MATRNGRSAVVGFQAGDDSASSVGRLPLNLAPMSTGNAAASGDSLDETRKHKLARQVEDYGRILDTTDVVPNYPAIKSLFEGNEGCASADTVPNIQVSFELFETVQNRFANTKQVLERTKEELIARNQQYSLLQGEMQKLQADYAVSRNRATEAEERNTALHQQIAKLEVMIEQLQKEAGQIRTEMTVVQEKLVYREEELQASQNRVAEGLVTISQKEAAIATLRRELAKYGRFQRRGGTGNRDGRKDGEGGDDGDGEYTQEALESIAADVEGRSKEARMKLNLADLEAKTKRTELEKQFVLQQHDEYRRHVEQVVSSLEAQTMEMHDAIANHGCIRTPFFLSSSYYNALLHPEQHTAELEVENAQRQLSGAPGTSPASDAAVGSFYALSYESRRALDRLKKINIDGDSRLRDGLCDSIAAQQKCVQASAELIGFLTTLEKEITTEKLSLPEVKEEWRKAQVPFFASRVAKELTDGVAAFSRSLVRLLQQENEVYDSASRMGAAAGASSSGSAPGTLVGTSAATAPSTAPATSVPPPANSTAASLPAPPRVPTKTASTMTEVVPRRHVAIQSEPLLEQDVAQTDLGERSPGPTPPSAQTSTEPRPASTSTPSARVRTFTKNVQTSVPTVDRPSSALPYHTPSTTPTRASKEDGEGTATVTTTAETQTSTQASHAGSPTAADKLPSVSASADGSPLARPASSSSRAASPIVVPAEPMICPHCCHPLVSSGEALQSAGANDNAEEPTASPSVIATPKKTTRPTGSEAIASPPRPAPTTPTRGPASPPPATAPSPPSTASVSPSSPTAVQGEKGSAQTPPAATPETRPDDTPNTDDRAVATVVPPLHGTDSQPPHDATVPSAPAESDAAIRDPTVSTAPSTDASPPAQTTTSTTEQTPVPSAEEALAAMNYATPEEVAAFRAAVAASTAEMNATLQARDSQQEAAIASLKAQLEMRESRTVAALHAEVSERQHQINERDIEIARLRALLATGSAGATGVPPSASRPLSGSLPAHRLPSVDVVENSPLPPLRTPPAQSKTSTVEGGESPWSSATTGSLVLKNPFESTRPLPPSGPSIFQKKDSQSHSHTTDPHSPVSEAERQEMSQSLPRARTPTPPAATGASSSALHPSSRPSSQRTTPMLPGTSEERGHESAAMGSGGVARPSSPTPSQSADAAETKPSAVGPSRPKKGTKSKDAASKPTQETRVTGSLTSKRAHSKTKTTGKHTGSTGTELRPTRPGGVGGLRGSHVVPHAGTGATDPHHRSPSPTTDKKSPHDSREPSRRDDENGLEKDHASEDEDEDEDDTVLSRRPPRTPLPVSVPSHLGHGVSLTAQEQKAYTQFVLSQYRRSQAESRFAPGSYASSNSAATTYPYPGIGVFGVGLGGMSGHSGDVPHTFLFNNVHYDVTPYEEYQWRHATAPGNRQPHNNNNNITNQSGAGHAWTTVPTASRVSPSAGQLPPSSVAQGYSSAIMRPFFTRADSQRYRSWASSRPTSGVRQPARRPRSAGEAEGTTAGHLYHGSTYAYGRPTPVRGGGAGTAAGGAMYVTGLHRPIGQRACTQPVRRRPVSAQLPSRSWWLSRRDPYTTRNKITVRRARQFPTASIAYDGIVGNRLN